MKIVEGLKYSKEHEWLKVEGNRAYVGITDYAQHALGSIVFVELPKVGKKLVPGDVLGVVESVKAASDIYMPVSGIVIDINNKLVENPEKMNEEPYESWIALIEITNVNELGGLMDAAKYAQIQ
jgi:glycine cleavage system H protein